MKLNKKNILALGLSLLFLLLAFHGIDFRRLLDTLSDFNYKMLFVIVPLILSAMILRGIRWKGLLDNNKNLSVIELSEIFIAGTTLNIYLPARAGDLFRAYFLGNKHNRPKLEIFASIVIERIIDGLTVLSILITATFLYYKASWAFDLSTIAAVFFVGSLSAIYFTFKYNKTNQITCYIKKRLTNLPNNLSSNLILATEKIRGWINTFLDSAGKVLKTRVIFNSFGISFLIWAIECATIYLLITGFDIPIHFSAALFVISFIALASVIPSTSIYIGPFQYAFILALTIYKIDKSSALAIAFTFQSITLIILSIIFIIFVLKNNLNTNTFNSSNLKE